MGAECGRTRETAIVYCVAKVNGGVSEDITRLSGFQTRAALCSVSPGGVFGKIMGAVDPWPPGRMIPCRRCP